MNEQAKLYIETGVKIFGFQPLAEAAASVKPQMAARPDTERAKAPGALIGGAIAQVAAQASALGTLIAREDFGVPDGHSLSAFVEARPHLMPLYCRYMRQENDAFYVQLQAAREKNLAQSKEIENLRQQNASIFEHQCKLEEALSLLKEQHGATCVQFGELKGAYGNRETELRKLTPAYEKALTRANTLQAALNEANAGLNGALKEISYAQASVKREQTIDG